MNFYFHLLSRLSNHWVVWVFPPLVTSFFWPLSTMCSFRHLLALPQFPRGHFAHQMTCIAYWEVQASAPVVFLIVLQVGFTTVVVKVFRKKR